MEEPGVSSVKGRKAKNVMVTNGNETIPKEYVLSQSASLASLNKARSLSHDLYGSLENGYSDTLNVSEDISQRCFLCQTNDQSGDLFRCNWCRRVSVCSNHHFRVYHRVRSRCWPFHLAPKRKDSPPGKFHLRLTATRDIKKGEIIFIEASTLATPQPHSFPTCPVCLRRLRADAFTKCNSCSIPLCGSLVCANSSVHQIECRVLTENKINLSSLVNNFTRPHFIYSVIILLRMCALEQHAKAAELLSGRTKKSNDDQPKGGARHRPRDMVQSEELLLREFVFQLPDHVEKRRGLGEWKMFQKDVVDFLRRRCFMANEKSDEQLHKLLGIFMAHSTTIDSRVISSGTNEGEKHLVQGRLLFPSESSTSLSGPEEMLPKGKNSPYLTFLQFWEITKEDAKFKASGISNANASGAQIPPSFTHKLVKVDSCFPQIALICTPNGFAQIVILN
ncbi:hypothetical protein TCAL_04165 [Tigriopus californicus]|uniref:MYND-type domain-containing protein n=1 Tax=Tigriopus californicus TaxID=6832 RepID=A0A553NS26_TIGCA|nr:hypothetical protein TCAL_04165 [Tigriopus californicus]